LVLVAGLFCEVLLLGLPNSDRSRVMVNFW
jgi:hypothetical protein